MLQAALWILVSLAPQGHAPTGACSDWGMFRQVSGILFPLILIFDLFSKLRVSISRIHIFRTPKVRNSIYRCYICPISNNQIRLYLEFRFQHSAFSIRADRSFEIRVSRIPFLPIISDLRLFIVECSTIFY